MQHWSATIMFVAEMVITNHPNSQVKLRKNGHIKSPAENCKQHAFLGCMLQSLAQAKWKSSLSQRIQITIQKRMKPVFTTASKYEGRNCNEA